MGRARLGNYLLGVEGVALIRRWLTGSSSSDERVRGIIRLVNGLGEGLPAIEMDVPELDVAAGYGSWAATYDGMPNPLIRVEEPAVRALVAERPAGRALDAACGTGRHTAFLRERGHSVVGVDVSPEMLDRARQRLPDVEFREGDLDALPVDDATMDLVVCALALSHVADLGPAMAELARVTKPGGHIIVSDFHPLNVALGGQALFQKSDGGYAFVKGYLHQIGEYVSAAAAAGLHVVRCLEPAWTEEEVAMIAGPLLGAAPEAFREAFVGLPGAVVLEFARPV